MTAVPAVLLPAAWTVHGLRFAQDGRPDADVTLRRGAIPVVDPDSADPPPGGAVAPNEWRLQIPGGLRLRASGGTMIELDLDSGVDPVDVATWITGPATTAILYQRGIAPLHASAIVVNGGAVAFLAESGTGKSSLAAAFAADGAVVLTDDVLATGLDDAGCPYAWPGAAGLRLGAVTRSTLDQSRFPIIRGAVDDKVVVAPPAGVASAPVPFRALFFLEIGAALDGAPMHGFDLLVRLRSLLQRPGMAGPLGAEAAIFRILGSLVERVPGFVIRRPSGEWTLPAVQRLVRDSLAGLGSFPDERRSVVDAA